MTVLSLLEFPMLPLLALCLWLVTVGGAQDLKSLFETQQPGFNVSLVLPGDPTYTNASKPFNLRFDFEPAGIAFPTTVQEVSEIVKLGQLVNHQVVARSGGVVDRHHPR
ncbi:hypothetical protein HYPSUDRAFT_39906 [Hypholoma sublateritium FD-334 SS-4]|uniref:Uncharacterized protein n=1 Tax=Hypholoma sublateritium (strain FD-334 SS-4) TaxID=945553 RepID=A0A0D2P423_HYPSF|nr:hypothetical protein HYPSUDRAFT_39906 [Hypholoma sublateritium FD-334 SS-4]